MVLYCPEPGHTESPRSGWQEMEESGHIRSMRHMGDARAYGPLQPLVRDGMASWLWLRSWPHFVLTLTLPAPHLTVVSALLAVLCRFGQGGRGKLDLQHYVVLRSPLYLFPDRLPMSVEANPVVFRVEADVA